MADRPPHDQAVEIRTAAKNLRSPFAAFRVLSGSFRGRIAEALGAAAVLHEDRLETQEDRHSIQRELNGYREQLSGTRDEVHRLAAALSATLKKLETTEAEVLEVQRSTLSQEKKSRELAEEDRRLLALSEDLGRRHHETQVLFERLKQESSANALLLSQTREIEEAIRSQLAALDGRGAKIATDEKEIAERRRELATGEGALESGRVALRESESRASMERAEVAEKEARLAELQSRVERDQAAVGEAQAQVLSMVQRAQEHERSMSAHYDALETRLKAQDARDQALDLRRGELDVRALETDRERVEVDGKISRLSDLEQRNEQLLRFKAYLDEDQKRLNSEFSGVRDNQRLTVETWDELKKTLARIEELGRRVQETHDTVERLRSDTERAGRESAEAARRRSLALDGREREILNWRMQSELRERKVQERYNELDTLELRKTAVRGDIEKLEREHTTRASEWEREQQRARQTWAERRAEAEKARELYERNAGLLDRRLAEVASREKEHQSRAEALEERTGQIAERERRLRAAEERIRLLEEQRDSLNAVIASLTTQVGREWPSPEARLESGLTPPPLDGASVVAPSQRRPDSSLASKPATADGRPPA